MEGILHQYQLDPPLNLFEYTPRPPAPAPSPSTTTPPNVLLFIGGLYDNFQSPAYLADLARLFPRQESQQWALIHVQLSSAILCFGTSDIDQDIEDMALAITYIRNVIREGQPTNIVLMGHSTGCQDVMHYLSSPYPASSPRPKVQGAIFQAPVSDREAVFWKMDVAPECKEKFALCMALIETVPEERHSTYMLPLDWTRPLFGRAPLCVARFLDLVSPTSPEAPRKEDLFSTDLPQSRLDATWGRIGPNQVLTRVPGSNYFTVLTLFSESDIVVFPPGVVWNTLLETWAKMLSDGSDHAIRRHSESTMIPNATHDFSGEALAQRKARMVGLRRAVVRYLHDTIGVDDGTWDILNADMAHLDDIKEEAGHA